MKHHYQEAEIEKSFKELIEKSEEKTLTLQEISQVLSQKTRPIFILFLSLPFCIFLPFPGFSIPFGLAIMFFSLRILLRKKTYLPKKFLRKKISSKILKKIAKKGIWLLKKSKHFLHPRFSWFFKPLGYQISAAFLLLMGFFLALPFPIPFTNVLPAWSIFLISLGLIEEDGLFVFLGFVLGSLLIFISILFLNKI